MDFYVLTAAQGDLRTELAVHGSDETVLVTNVALLNVVLTRQC